MFYLQHSFIPFFTGNIMDYKVRVIIHVFVYFYAFIIIHICIVQRADLDFRSKRCIKIDISCFITLYNTLNI